MAVSNNNLQVCVKHIACCYGKLKKENIQLDTYDITVKQLYEMCNNIPDSEKWYFSKTTINHKMCDDVNMKLKDIKNCNNVCFYYKIKEDIFRERLRQAEEKEERRLRNRRRTNLSNRTSRRIVIGEPPDSSADESHSLPESLMQMLFMNLMGGNPDNMSIKFTPADAEEEEDMDEEYFNQTSLPENSDDNYYFEHEPSSDSPLEPETDYTHEPSSDSPPEPETDYTNEPSSNSPLEQDSESVPKQDSKTTKEDIMRKSYPVLVNGFEDKNLLKNILNKDDVLESVLSSKKNRMILVNFIPEIKEQVMLEDERLNSELVDFKRERIYDYNNLINDSELIKKGKDLIDKDKIKLEEELISYRDEKILSILCKKYKKDNSFMKELYKGCDYNIKKVQMLKRDDLSNIERLVDETATDVAQVTSMYINVCDKDYESTLRHLSI